MEPRDMLELLKGEVDKLKAKGATSISMADVDLLLKWADSRAADSVVLAGLKHQADIATAQMSYDAALKSGDAVIEAGKSAVSSLILVNGGAAVAMLSFLGSSKAPAALLKLPLLDFGLGVAAGVLAFGLRYFAQQFYGRTHSPDWTAAQQKKFGRWGDRFNNASIAMGFGGLACFCLGLGNAYLAF